MMEKTLLVTGRLNVLFDLNVCPFVTPVGIHQGESTIIAGNEIIQNVADIDGFCRRLGCIKKHLLIPQPSVQQITSYQNTHIIQDHQTTAAIQ